METIVASKGQITISAHIRRELGIKPGTRIHVELDAATQRIILTPITRTLIHSLRETIEGWIARGCRFFIAPLPA